RLPAVEGERAHDHDGAGRGDRGRARLGDEAAQPLISRRAPVRSRAMTRFLVRPGHRIEGTVRIPGATKNSGTKQMAAALLAPGITRITNIPPVADLDVMVELLGVLGAQAEWAGADTLTIDASYDLEPEAPYEIVSRMRASINVLGPLLARTGEARV